VNYEYEEFSSFKQDSFGVQVKQNLSNHLKVGGTYVEQDKNDADYSIRGANAELRYDADTFVSVDYNVTEETQMVNNTSIDGGLTIDTQGIEISDGESGYSTSVRAQYKPFDTTLIKGSFSKQTENYSSTGNTSLSGSETITAQIIQNIFSNIKLSLKHRIQNSETTSNEALGDNNKVTTSTVGLNMIKSEWDYRLEYLYQEVTKEQELSSWQGSLSQYSQEVIGARTGYQLNEKSKVYIGGQASVSGYKNEKAYLGMIASFDNGMSVDIRQSIGKQGNATSLGLSKKVSVETDKTLNFESGHDAFGEKYSKTSFGINSAVSKNSNVYYKTDYSSYNSRLVESQIIGHSKSFSDNLKMDMSYESASYDETSVAINRDVGALLMRYDVPGTCFISSKLEMRRDVGLSKKYQYVTINNFRLNLLENLEVSSRVNYSIIKNDSTEEDEGGFLEFGIGFAYRPLKSDKLNLLSRYSRITEDDLITRNTPLSLISSEKRDVFSLEGIYDFNHLFQAVGKVAYRLSEEKVGPRDWVESDTYLYLGRLNYHIINNWDIGAEYRVFENKQNHDTLEGWLLEINRNFGRYFKLGVGYNFTEYNDDLRYKENFDSKGWFLRAIGKY